MLDYGGWGGGSINICAHVLFCAQFNAQELLFEAFLDVMRIFASVEA